MDELREKFIFVSVAKRPIAHLPPFAGEKGA
jgi:hypothetical protein